MDWAACTRQHRPYDRVRDHYYAFVALVAWACFTFCVWCRSPFGHVLVAIAKTRCAPLSRATRAALQARRIRAVGVEHCARRRAVRFPSLQRIEAEVRRVGVFWRAARHVVIAGSTAILAPPSRAVLYLFRELHSFWTGDCCSDSAWCSCACMYSPGGHRRHRCKNPTAPAASSRGGSGDEPAPIEKNPRCQNS